MRFDRRPSGTGLWMRTIRHLAGVREMPAATRVYRVPVMNPPVRNPVQEEQKP